MNYEIPEDQQENVLNSFWVMLQECETKAINSDPEDPVLKNWVEQWYEQYNKLTGGICKPFWRTE